MLKAYSVVPMVAVFAAGISALSAQPSNERSVIRPAAARANAPTPDWPFVQRQQLNTNTFSTRGLPGADYSRAADSDRLFGMLVNGLDCRGNPTADCSPHHGRDLRPMTWIQPTDAPVRIFDGPDRPVAAPVTTPEPITMLLVGSGLAGIAAVARRGRLNQSRRKTLE